MKRLIPFLAGFLFFNFHTSAQTAFLDTTFADKGFITTNWGDSQSFTSFANMLIQPDDKILVRQFQITDVNSQKGEIRLARYLRDGQPDLTFGNQGVIWVNPESGNNLTGFGDKCLILRPNGKILTAFSIYNPTEYTLKTVLKQYDQQGIPDPLFGTNGVLTMDETLPGGPGNFPSIQDIGRLDNDKILLFYQSFNQNYVDFGFRETTAFGTFPPGSEVVWWVTDDLDELARKVIIQPDNRILLGGRVVNHDAPSSNYDMLLARFDSDGYVDENFGNFGYVRKDISGDYDLINDFMLLPDGKIMAAGVADDFKMFLARFLPNGTPDSSFAGTGVRIYDNIPNTGTFSVAFSDLGISQKLVVKIENPLDVATLFRFYENGDMDSTLNQSQGLKVPTPATHDRFRVRDLELLDDNRILVCGNGKLNGSINQLIVARLLPEAGATPWYQDRDQDNFGANDYVLFAVEKPDGYVAPNGDCNDLNPDIHPGAPELCNGDDDDCDGLIDETPVLLCIENVIVALDQNGEATLIPDQIRDNTTPSPCDENLVSITIDQTDFDCSQMGENTITLSATNTFGESGSCATTVTIADQNAPQAKCVLVLTATLDDTGFYTLSTGQIDNGSTDNCGIATYTIAPPALTSTDIGLTPVTLTVTDASGNSATCVTIVELQETTGTLDAGFEKLITIAPNPASDKVFITVPAELLNAGFQLRLIDLQGRILRHENWRPTGNCTPMNISDLKPNQYFLLLESSGKSQVFSFQKI